MWLSRHYLMVCIFPFIRTIQGSHFRSPVSRAVPCGQLGMQPTGKAYGLFLRAAATISAPSKASCSSATAATTSRVWARSTGWKHNRAGPHADLEVPEETRPACLLLYLSLQQGQCAPTAVPQPARDSHFGLPVSPELLRQQGHGMLPFTEIK